MTPSLTLALLLEIGSKCLDIERTLVDGYQNWVCNPGGTPYNGYTGKLRPKGVPFSCFRYMKGVGPQDGASPY